MLQKVSCYMTLQLYCKGRILIYLLLCHHYLIFICDNKKNPYTTKKTHIFCQFCFENFFVRNT